MKMDKKIWVIALLSLVLVSGCVKDVMVEKNDLGISCYDICESHTYTTLGIEAVGYGEVCFCKGVDGGIWVFPFR